MKDTKTISFVNANEFPDSRCLIDAVRDRLSNGSEVVFVVSEDGVRFAAITTAEAKRIAIKKIAEGFIS